MISHTSVARAVRFDKAIFACALVVGVLCGGLFVGLGVVLDMLATSGDGEWMIRFATGFICGFAASLLGLLTDYQSQK